MAAGSSVSKPLIALKKLARQAGPCGNGFASFHSCPFGDSETGNGKVANS